MSISLQDFCERLGNYTQLDSTKKAFSILLWHELFTSNPMLSSGAIATIMRGSGVGTPNSTALGKSLSRTRLVLKSGNGFRLKAGAANKIQDWLGDILDYLPVKIDQKYAYLPEAIWQDTRGYLQKVCVQLNGCFKYGFFDAASVMMRRIAETLIIEAFEHLKRADEIKGTDGNFFMLGDLVKAAIARNGLNIGREAKKALSTIKTLGDRSAHNRRYNAVKPDLDGEIKSGLRLAVEELINLADLRRHSKKV